MAYSQTQPALLMKGTYSVVTIFKNAAQRTGRPWWNVMLQDGGKLPCFTYSAISNLIGQNEERRDYNPPIMVEFYIDPRQTGAVIVPKPAMPPASTALPPPPTGGPTLEQTEGVVYGPSRGAVAPGAPVQASLGAPAPQYPGTAAPPRQAQPSAAAASMAQTQYPGTAAPPAQQPGPAVQQPLPGQPAMTKAEEITRRERMELIKNRQIARMNALTQITNVLTNSALAFQERMDRLSMPETLQKAEALARYIETGETCPPEQPQGEDTTPF